MGYVAHLRSDAADGRDDVDDIDKKAYHKCKCKESDEELVKRCFVEGEDGAMRGYGLHDWQVLLDNRRDFRVKESGGTCS